MTDSIDGRELAYMMGAVVGTVAAFRAELNQLDAAIGDGDHGSNVRAAFELAVEEINKLERSETPSAVWQTTARAVMKRMGGASGALFGTLFLGAARAAQGRRELVKADLDDAWLAALEAVKARGKTQVGEKTMVDALEPAVLAFVASAGLSQAWREAALAAHRGAEATANLVAQKGRAKYLGERAIGHRDPGAVTISLMFKAFNEFWSEREVWRLWRNAN